MAQVGADIGATIIKHLPGRMTSAMRSAFRMLNVGTDGTQEASKFITTDTNTNQGAVNVTAFHVGATSSEVELDATPKEINEFADVSARGVILITTKAVEETDNNKVFFLNLAAGFTVTLPKLSEVYAGWSCKFIVKTVPTTAYIITEDAASETDKIRGGFDTGIVLTASDSPTSGGCTFITFVANEADPGDFCIFETDGLSWFCYGRTEVLAAVTMT